MSVPSDAPAASSARLVYADAVTASDESSKPEKMVAPAADRNKDAILASLRKYLAIGRGGAGGDAAARVLEIASGTGQHAAYFVENLQGLVTCWQPTDHTDLSLRSIHAYRADLPEHLQTALLEPQQLDVRAWPARFRSGDWDAMLAVNLIHIAPPDVTDALLSGASVALREGGRLMLYGPFLVDGKPTTESNAAFDAKLKSMDPSFGLRDVGDVAEKAGRLGLQLVARDDMPSNNFFVVFEKSSAEGSCGGRAAPAPL